MNIPTTNELLERLNNTENISALDDYTEDTSNYHLVTTFSEFMENKLRESNLSPARVIESAQIQRNYGYQILNGTKKPGRDKIIALCLALELPLDDVQRALTLAKEGILYPKNIRDSILIFCINKKISVMRTNELLDIKGEYTL